MDFGSGIFDDSGRTGPSSPEELPAMAGSKSPWLGVHVLTEFIFFPRAGLLEYEHRKVETGDENKPAPRLDYLPDYEVEVIREKLDCVRRQSRGAAACAGLLLAAMFVVSYFDVVTSILIGAGGLIGTGNFVATEQTQGITPGQRSRTKTGPATAAEEVGWPADYHGKCHSMCQATLVPDTCNEKHGYLVRTMRLGRHVRRHLMGSFPMPPYVPSNCRAGAARMRLGWSCDTACLCRV